MKTFLLLAISFTVALAQAVNAENQDQDQVKAPKNRSKVAKPTVPVAPPHAVPQPAGPPATTVSKPPHINQKTLQPNQYSPNVQPTARVHTKPAIPNTSVPRTPAMVQSAPDAPKENWQKKNWQNRTVNNNSWEEARRRHHRHHHHRDWWRSRYSRFALFGSGYYFWDGGYWYPAYGYDPAYNRYAYDEPIYGYNHLNPAQVIASVQTELQRRGYYRFAVDGQIGPMTRAAIANYQRDQGLSITSAIDQPTLASLGLG